MLIKIYIWFILCTYRNVVILGVLDEEEDVLENVNILDLEKSVKNVENKKKKPDYRPYEEPEFDEFGIVSQIFINNICKLKFYLI